MSRSHLVLMSLLAFGCKKKDVVEPTTTDGGGDPSEISLEIVSPALGAHVPTGSLTVDGTQSGLSNLTMNGDGMDAADGSFSVELEAERGINAFEAFGEKGTTFRLVRRSVLAGVFGDPSGPIPDAVGIRLNQGGLDAVGVLVSNLADPATLEAGVKAANPLYESFVVDVYLETLAFDPLRVDFDPQPGKLLLDLVIPQLDILLRLDTLGDIDLYATADEARVSGVVVLGTDGQGHLTADFTEASVELVNFDYDTSLIPGDWSFGEGTIEGIMEDTLLGQIEALVPGLLADQLSTLELAFDLDLLGTPVSISSEFAAAGVDGDGVQLVVDIDVEVPSNGTKVSPGFLTANVDRPVPNKTADMSMSLSDDLVNRLLFEAWTGGLVDLSLSTDDGSLPGAYLEPFGTNQGTITLDAKLPPVLVQKGEETELQIGELHIRLDTPTNEDFKFIDLALSAKIPVDLEVVNGSLTVRLGDPDLDFIVRDTDWNVENSYLTTLLEEQLPLDSLIVLFGNFSFELPTIGGLSLQNAAIDRDESGVFTNVAVEL
jgi:hypothetical protein